MNPGWSFEAGGSCRTDAMAWLRRRPPGRSRSIRVWLYARSWALPTCSDIPTLAGQRRLLFAHRDPDHAHAVAGCGVNRQRAPAAAHVQQSHPWVQAELGAYQFALVLLCLVQSVVRAGLLRPVGAGVDHARTQDQPVELITDVVMVGNRLGIPSGAVESAAAPTYFLCGRARRWSHRTDPSSGHRGCEALPR